MFRVRHITVTEGEEFETPYQALRQMARIIRRAPLTPGERRAFETWYTQANARTAAQRLRCFTRYEFGFSINGTRQAYVIEHLPAMPQDPVACVILRAPDGSETPRLPRSAG